eukprot:m.66795 g.66795  ORF g.66795 m.66795 type:complete len:182 (+) comp14071_c0_seq2:7-552(+)
MADDEVGLPRAAVNAAIREILPAGIRCSAEGQALFSTCLNELVNLIAFEANDKCAKRGKTTISPEDILESLHSLGLDEFVAAAKEALEALKDESKTKQQTKKRRNSKQDTGMTEEELRIQQERLFAQARAAQELELQHMNDDDENAGDGIGAIATAASAGDQPNYDEDDEDDDGDDAEEGD